MFRKVKENIGFPLIVLIIEETIDIGAEGNKQKICYWLSCSFLLLFPY